MYKGVGVSFADFISFSSISHEITDIQKRGQGKVFDQTL